MHLASGRVKIQVMENRIAEHDVDAFGVERQGMRGAQDELRRCAIHRKPAPRQADQIGRDVDRDDVCRPAGEKQRVAA